MKLKKYDKNKKMKTCFIVSTIICVVFIGLFVYQSYGRYQDKVTFKLINGKLKMSGGTGDIEFAFYKGDQKVDSIPLKEDGVLYIGSVCTNDAIAKLNSENNDIIVSNLTKAKTNCTLYFGSKEDSICALHADGAACKLYTAGETEELLYDTTEDKNLRFVGSDPKNYVYFNCEKGKEASFDTCETWRIIGIINSIEGEDGAIGSHLKIIRDKFEKGYSWYSSSSKVNGGYGINEWSEAGIKKLLNEEYLYRRTGTNLCYVDSEGVINSTTTCPNWPNVGIRDEARNIIESVKWHTGTYSENWRILRNNPEKSNAKALYEAEKSNHHGKELCQRIGGTYCNDDVGRTTTWTGKVGLMYPSDYGYAVGGTSREVCLEKTLGYTDTNCRDNDWLRDASDAQWTMTPAPDSSSAGFVLIINSGSVNDARASSAYAIRPTLYLKSDVKIIDRDYEDYGSIDHPIELSYE